MLKKDSKNKFLHSREVFTTKIPRLNLFLEVIFILGDCETGLVFDVQKRQTPDFVGDKQEK